MSELTPEEAAWIMNRQRLSHLVPTMLRLVYALLSLNGDLYGPGTDEPMTISNAPAAVKP
jgi:hypothetical protein